MDSITTNEIARKLLSSSGEALDSEQRVVLARLIHEPADWGVPGLMCRWPCDPGARFRRRFSPQQNRWLFEVDGRWLGLCAAQPRWLCRRWPETGGDGFEYAGVGAC